VIVTIVAVAHVRIGLWEDLVAGEIWAYCAFGVFCYHTVLVYLSHGRVMGTGPGYIPKNCDKLDTSKMSEELVNTLYEIKGEVMR